MLSGILSALNLSANALTELREERSSSRTSILAFVLLIRMSCLASFAALVFLAAMITRAPLSANTLVVSNPMPLAPPTQSHIYSHFLNTTNI